MQTTMEHNAGNSPKPPIAPTAPAERPEWDGKRPTPEELREWIRPVQDPELFMSLVDLGLIYSVEMVGERAAGVKMTLTSPGCPAGGYMVKQIEDRLKEHPAVLEAYAEIVWEPKWDPKTMASEEAKETLGIW